MISRTERGRAGTTSRVVIGTSEDADHVGIDDWHVGIACGKIVNPIVRTTMSFGIESQEFPESRIAFA